MIMNVSNVKVIKERDALMDTLKFFAIFLVLWGHSIQHFRGGNAYDNPMYVLIYLFYMPLFMIISGFFAKGAGNGRTFKEILFKRVRQLLIPALFGTVML